MENKTLLIIFILFSLAILGCSNQSEPASVSVEVSAPDTNNEQNIVEIDVVAKKWEFTPNTITVKKGDLVKLSIESIDADHGIEISEFGVSQKLTPGEIEVVEFTADKTGSFSFFCNVYCGSGHSEMKGTLIVEA